MDKTTHTKGPRTTDGEFIFAAGPGQMQIAVIDTTADDAALIAAAPDLYTELTQILNRYEEACMLAGYEPDDNPAVQRARAALAKASGQ